MKRFTVVPAALFSAALFSATAFAQAPTVTLVDPTSGPSMGGTEVVITGTNLLTKVQCIVPCPARVGFGDITVDVKSETATRLVVITPPHQPGTVDLTISVAGETPVKVTNGFQFTEDHDDRYEEVLLPVYLDETVPGAFGSVWKSDFWLHNDVQEPLYVAPWPCPLNQVCPPVYPLTKTVLQNETVHNLDPLFHEPSANPSRILYLSHKNASMSLRIGDISRSTLNAGTDIPVVRESEMRTGLTQLFKVPMTPDFRVMLRVYDTARTQSSFVVRVYDQSNLTASAPPAHTFTLTATTAQTNDFRTEAAYAQFDITSLLQLNNLFDEYVRLEIEPQQPGSRYWAFASITNNATQLITLSTPQ